MMMYSFADSSNSINEFFEDNIGGMNLRIYPGGYCEFNSNCPANGMHYHNCYELSVVVSGSGEYVHGKDRYLLKAGDVFVADPEILHEIRLAESRKSNCENRLGLVYFLVSINSLIKEMGGLFETTILQSFLSGHNIVKSSQLHLTHYIDFMNSYNQYISSSSLGRKHLTLTLILECILCLLNESIKDNINQSQHHQIIESAAEYIKYNIYSKLSLKDIAKRSNTSIRNLQHVFKKYLNKTVIEYINERKMSIAASYLRMNFNVSDAGKLIGIGDNSQFSRMFKKYYGVSPKKFQMMYSKSSFIHSVGSR